MSGVDRLRVIGENVIVEYVYELFGYLKFQELFEVIGASFSKLVSVIPSYAKGRLEGHLRANCSLKMLTKQIE